MPDQKKKKDITIKYHHFRSYVANGSIQIFPIDTKDQLANIFTKLLDRVVCVKLRRLLMGWYIGYTIKQQESRFPLLITREYKDTVS